TFALIQPVPVCGPASPLYVMKLIPLTRLFSTRISLATAWSISFAPPLVASLNVMVGSYLAWIGQIGMQLVLPAQARRFRYGWELRAAGRLLTLIPVTGWSIPRNLVSSSVNFASASPTR